jgi:uncharacterized protein
MESKINLIIQSLDKILTSNPVCKSHDLHHMTAVMKHAIKALEYYPHDIDEHTKYLVIIASLLHDCDDKKFFPNNKNNDNTRTILKEHNFDNKDIELVTNMIDLVSSSKNGDYIDSNIPEYMYYPRYADRLEAIGIIGIKRCYQYAVTANLPLYLDTTMKAINEEELWKIATIDRYQNYKNSVSMIDHYYDKLLRLGTFPIKNKYFDERCKQSNQPLIEIVLTFGRQNIITKSMIDGIINKYSTNKQQTLPLPNAKVFYTPDYLDKEVQNYLMENISKIFSTQEHKKVITQDAKYTLNRKTIVFIDKNIDKNLIPKIWGNEVLVLEFPDYLQKIKDSLEIYANFKFNICLANYYSSGKKSIGYHTDNEEKGSTSCIASLSIGAERPFYFRNKGEKEACYTLVLTSGSLLIMADKCQDNYEHALLNCKNCHEPRLNLTFRLFDSTRYSSY